MVIDAFSHGLTEALRSAVLAEAGPAAELANWGTGSPLADIGSRLAAMDEYGVSMQVLTTPSPPLESLCQGDALHKLAVVANDSMANLVSCHPDRFRGVATVPLADPDWAVREVTRSVRELGLCGVLLYSHASGRALDSPELENFLAAVEELNVPVWLHPDWADRRPDYPGEERSRYGLDLVLGWPHETSVALARLVMSGVMARHPGLKLIVHHAGAMIPFFLQRIEMHYPSDEELGRLERPQVRGQDLVDGLRAFYIDTVTQGSLGALMAAYSVYGADHMLLGSDMPFGPGRGKDFLRVAVESVAAMPISQEDKEKICWRNAAALCSLSIHS